MIYYGNLSMGERVGDCRIEDFSQNLSKHSTLIILLPKKEKGNEENYFQCNVGSDFDEHVDSSI